MDHQHAYAAGELDREVVLTRVVAAPIDRVYEAWSDSRRLLQWFGPRGYSCQAVEHGEARPGAVWRFTMTGPDGTRWDNRMRFLEVLPGERLVFEHGRDLDDDPGRWRVTIAFHRQGEARTVVTLRQLHPTRAQRDAVIGFGAVELGYQTLDKLAEQVAAPRDVA